MIVLQIAATAILAGLTIMLVYGIAGKSDTAYMGLLVSVSLLAIIGLVLITIGVIRLWGI